ncbi:MULTISPECIES: CYTH domain-containing protein [unclassified Paenibacillus]|uniref:CYTH domain-containing protein n=1 Tax=unclassified Paenibacillus TaxID=185978 RepID=UPI0010437B0C|nr:MULTISPECIES: CYTH domain-containing protein [unclassified Paenibacillus]NIK70659.1 CYTH domain-containing protein [Paenibacillus sp. BK720]TCM86431.1 CYTH domain-containing protein [Paenibacillus sp. BK033]
MALEIERKFLLAVPYEQLEGRIQVRSEQRIEQTYLALEADQELRVRRITDVDNGEITYTHTFKKGFGIKREEVEYEINEGLYEQVVKAFGAVALTKNRITAEWNGIGIEIDIYDQIQLTVLEVEFDSEEAAHSFEAPEWFGEDISSSKEYSNKTVWKQLQRK